MDDDLRPEIKEELARQQAGLGDLGDSRRRVLQGAAAARHAGEGNRRPIAAGIAVVVLTALVVGSFSYIRYVNGRPNHGPPLTVGETTPSPSQPDVSPSPTAEPSPSPSPSPSSFPTTSPVPGTTPMARLSAAMTYDPVHHVAVVFGGDGANGWLNDTWTWDGTKWTQVTPMLSPSPRQMAEMVWDASANQAVLFGGINAEGNVLSDTWAWNGKAWSALHPAHSPPARAPLAMAYDATGSRIVLYGGRKTPVSPAATDTWIWSDGDWTQLTDSPVANVADNPSVGLAWEPATSNLVLVDWNPGLACQSCNGGGIRVWRLAGTAWSSPTYIQCGCFGDGNVMAYDPGRKRWLFYGSQSAQSPWEVTVFDGLNRIGMGRVTPHPDASGDFMAWTYDPDHQQILVFGGVNAGAQSAQLWAWDFQRWSRLS